MEKFVLADYKDEIKQIATVNNVEPVEAVQLFIMNLTTMRDYYQGANVNYHALGQDWNRLLSHEKVSQKASMEEFFSASPSAKTGSGARR